MNESLIDTGAIEELVSVVVPVFFGMIAVTGLFGNSLVIFVVIANPQMRSTTNLLIVNLALADVLFVIFCIPFTATDYVLLQWPFGGPWCQCVQYLIVLFAHASIYTLVFMSLDRYLAVVHPIRSRSIRTERNTKIAIAILWAIILTASSPVAFMHGLDYCDETMATMCCRFLDSDFPLATFHITFMATSFILPLVLISGLYIRMIIRLWTTVVGNKLSSESQKGRKRVTRLVVVVVVAFASLWFPIQVILVLKSVDLFRADTTFKVLLQIFSQTLAYTSSCINPLLYAFLSENFRKAFRKAELFAKYVLKIDGDDVTAIAVAHGLNEIEETLKMRQEDDFLSPNAETEKQKLIDNGYKCNEMAAIRNEFFAAALSYFKIWTAQFESLKLIAWVTLKETPKWNDVEVVMNKLNELNLYKANEKAADLHTQFRYVKNFCTTDKITQWRDGHVSDVNRWVEIFNHLIKVECEYNEMATIVEYIVCLPGTSSSVERIFSAVNKTWTSDKIQLQVDTLKAILIVKCNLKYPCVDFYNNLKTKPELLRQIASKDKYETAASEEDIEMESDDD